MSTERNSPGEHSQPYIQGDQGPTSINFGATNASGSARIYNFGAVNAQNFIINDKPRPAEKVKPGSTVPFSRDDSFVARKGVFERLDEALYTAKSNRWAALCGLGGIGKSQLAIEYGYRVRDFNPAVWVFWVSAVNREAFVQSFAVIAERLNLDGETDSKTGVLATVSQWLSDESNGSWFVILDNEDDVEVLHDTCQDGKLSDTDQIRRLVDYIPKKSHGRVLVTSRNERAALSTVGDRKKIVKVEAMDEQESLKLLRSRVAVSPEDEEDARLLVSKLDYIPLAISQAGAYIHELRSMLTIKGYLAHFDKNVANQAKLLLKQKQELRRDSEVPSSVIVTWEMSFEHIKSKSIDAANLLCFLAMLHRQDIPVALVKSNDTMQTWEDIHLLEAYSFIAVSRPEKTVALGEDDRRLSLHRLVQLAVKVWLDSNNKLIEHKNSAFRKLTEQFQTDYSSRTEWDYNNLLILHADELLAGEQPTDKDLIFGRADLLDKVARQELSRGNYQVGGDRATESIKMWQLYYDGNNDDDDDRVRTLISRMTWASFLVKSQQIVQAEPILCSIEEHLRRKLDPDHKEMLRVWSLLASVYRQQGRFRDALKLDQRITDIAKTKYGPDHPTTLRAMSVTALTYSSSGRLHGAQVLGKQVYEATRKKLGADHPATLDSMSRLAYTYQRQGEFGKAIELLEELLVGRQAALGPEHPSIFETILALSHAYQAQMRFQEALVLLEKHVELSKAKLGPNNRTTLDILGRISVSLTNLGRYEEAEKIDVDLIKVMTASLGPYHELTLAKRAYLAWNWYYSGAKRDQAMKLLQEVVSLMNDHCGEKRELIHTWSPLLLHWDNDMRRRYTSSETFTEGSDRSNGIKMAHRPFKSFR